MREPSYYMSGGRLFILVEVTNRPTHPQPVCPYHHHHHYYCSSSSLLALTSSLALTVAMGAGRDNGRRWRQLLGQHCVCSGSSYDDTFMVVALGRASSWACSLGLGDYGGGPDYWLGRDALATPTLREERTGSRRPRRRRDGLTYLVTPSVRGGTGSRRRATRPRHASDTHPPCLLAARGGVTWVRRRDVAACVGSVALGVTHFTL